MRLIDQFHKIHALLEKQNAQPGLPALADALNCSERNARLLLRKMEQKVGYAGRRRAVAVTSRA
jgi:SgrR family transcriptional regulator